MAGAFLCALRLAGNNDGLVVTTNPPFLGFAAALVKWLRRKPYVNIVHDVYPDTAVSAGLIRRSSLVTFLWERITRLILRAATANVVIGRDMETLVRKKLGPRYRGQVVLIPNWADPKIAPISHDRNDFRREHNPQGHFLIQYSGTMARIHNVEPLVEAAALLQDQPILFQFIGEGFKKPLAQKMVQDLGLTNVQFLPFQPEERLAKVLSAADLAAVCLAPEFTGSSVPSKSYGVMAAGVPILGLLEPESEIGLTIKETDCGLVIPQASGQAVAEAIKALSANPERCKQMGENGRRAYEQRFTLEFAAAQFDRLFRNVFLERTGQGLNRR